MKTITLEKIKSMDPCSEGYVWYQENFPQKTNKVIDILNSLVSENKLNWANWLIVRCLTRKQKIQYAIFAAEQAIETYEKKHPDDERPRKAIEAAKEYSKTPSVENKFAAASASAAAYDAASAAYDAVDVDEIKVRIIRFGMAMLEEEIQ